MVEHKNLTLGAKFRLLLSHLNMKAYGRVKNIKGVYPWKRDYHIHRNNRKIGNWWEVEFDTNVSRGGLNQIVRKEIKKELDILYDLIYGDD